MKLLSSLLALGLCCTASSTGLTHLFTHDPHAPRQQPREAQTNAINARLVLAQRAGVEDYHTADILNEGAIEAINEHGSQRQLFGQEKTDVRRAFLLLEHAKEGVRVNLKDVTAHLHLTDRPSANSTSALFFDLARQHSPSAFPSDLSDDAVRALLRSSSPATLSDNDYFGIVDSPDHLDKTWNSFLARKGETWSVTALIAPEDGQGQDLWGTYAMPLTYYASLLHRRQAPQPEEPLEEAPPVEFTAPVPALASNNTNTTRLPGILPACFTSQSACESSTHNCTGHGKCQLSYTDTKRPDQSPFKECYACVCKPTISKDSEGRVTTTYWGGPGCQKKDVSASFWLIVLLSVAMVGLVSFAVGSVWGMGEEGLPSVLGAGVSGPSARR